MKRRKTIISIYRLKSQMMLEYYLVDTPLISINLYLVDTDFSFIPLQIK